MIRCTFLLLFLACILPGRSQLLFSDSESDLGTIPETYEIKGNVQVKNNSDKKIFLMRADADRGVRIYTSKKTLAPGDTCLLIISFVPESSGKFKKRIRLVASDKAEPYDLGFSGTLLKLKTDDKTACFYFGNRRSSTTVAAKDQVIAVNTEEPKRDNSNRMPDPSTPPRSEPVVEKPVIVPPAKPVQPPAESDPAELPLLGYKPNNILFLVDVSGSMKDSLKLPLMKEALHTLIDAVREVDYITFVTYADSTKIISEAVKGSDKATLHTAVNGLRSKGLTKGNKAILFSQQLAQKHFIPEGNNQIFLATDGKFRFNEEDVKTWTLHQAGKKIILTTVAFGNDKEAINNLEDIARKGEGSFIHIRKRNGSRGKLLEEVKKRSRR